jgi:5-methylcytosine-specific restriction endonuclease McrA
MLINYQNNISTVKCNICEVENTHDLSDKTSIFMEEFGEYENLMLVCPNCNAIEGFSMNIPLEENMENMPQEEQTQRTFLRQIIQTIREDFISV